MLTDQTYYQRGHWAWSMTGANADASRDLVATVYRFQDDVAV